MKADRLFGLVVAVLAALFLLVAVPAMEIDWDSGSTVGYYTVSPRFFPYTAGALCFLFAFLSALQPGGGNQVVVLRHAVARRNVGLTVGIAIVYAATLELLGFTIASILTLCAFFIGFGEKRWPWMVSIAVGLPVGINYCFARVFLVELPSGVLALPF